MPRKRYVCSVVSFSPSPSTGERVNVGVVVGNDEEGYRGRSVENLKRARCVDDAGQLSNESAAKSVGSFTERAATEPGLTEEKLKRRIGGTGNAMSSVQLGPLLPGLHYNLDAALQERFETHVVEPKEENGRG